MPLQHRKDALDICYQRRLRRRGSATSSIRKFFHGIRKIVDLLLPANQLAPSGVVLLGLSVWWSPWRLP